MAEAPKGPDTVMYMLVAAFIGMLFFDRTVPLPAANHDLIASGSDTLKNIMLILIGYRYGTSASSRAKDATIDKALGAQAAPKPPDAPTPPTPGGAP